MKHKKTTPNKNSIFKEFPIRAYNINDITVVNLGSSEPIYDTSKIKGPVPDTIRLIDTYGNLMPRSIDIPLPQNYTENTERVLMEHISINKENFDMAVPVVYPNKNDVYCMGICQLCGVEFGPRYDHRKLPCSHIFHGSCIYHWMIIKGKKFCPVDNFSYE